MQDTSTPRSVSLVVIYLTMNTNRLRMLAAKCGNLIYSFDKKDGRWEVLVIRKNAEKFLKAVIAFFDEEGMRSETKEGLSRLVLPFKDLLSRKKQKHLGLSMTPIGLVFNQCAAAVKKSLEPPVPEEKKAFLKWDKIIDGLLAGYTEKKQYTARKWLEMVEPNLKNAEA